MRSLASYDKQATIPISSTADDCAIEWDDVLNLNTEFPQIRVRQRADVVGHHRAPATALCLVRAEHEVLRDQLPAPVDQIQQRHESRFGVERVGLGDLDHR